MRTTRTKGRLTPNKAVTAFADALAEDDASTSTCSGYVQDVRGFFTWYMTVEGNRSPIRNVRAPDLGAYRDFLLDVERRKAATVNRKLQAIKRFYRHAVEAGWRKGDPTRKTKSVRTSKRLRPIGLTKKQETALLRAAGQSPRGLGARNYALVQLMLQAGLRVGEVSRLKRADVTLQPRSGEVIVNGKGRRQRTVPLNAAARRGLGRYLETRGEVAPAESLFASERGGALSKRSIQHAVSATAKRAGLDGVSVGAHTLRHTFAGRFLEDYPDQLVSLATLLGHESLDTTAVYVRPSAQDLARRLER